MHAGATCQQMVHANVLSGLRVLLRQVACCGCAMVHSTQPGAWGVLVATQGLCLLFSMGLIRV